MGIPPEQFLQLNIDLIQEKYGKRHNSELLEKIPFKVLTIL